MQASTTLYAISIISVSYFVPLHLFPGFYPLRVRQRFKGKLFRPALLRTRQPRLFPPTPNPPLLPRRTFKDGFYLPCSQQFL